jgi:predicted nucleic acid-binding protein
MMHLLDVNVWLALTFRRHVHHARAAPWFRAATAVCCFCRFTQAGFLRLATNPEEALIVGPAELFDEMESQLREVLEDEKEQSAWVRASTEDLIKRLAEDTDD